jgi:DNA-binding MarR family transcriptional regulator
MPMSSAVRRERSSPRRPGTASAEAQPRLNLNQSVGYLARYAHRAFAKALAAELAPHGILGGQWSVLRVLWEQEGLSQVDLAERMRVEKASLTGVLDAMERRKLIVRSRNSNDRRKVDINLTSYGRSLKAQLLPYGASINRRAARGMSATEVDQLRGLLVRVIRNLET